LQALSEKIQEALEAWKEVEDLKRCCQGQAQQVQEVERRLESAGEEVAQVRQLREASAACQRRAEVRPIRQRKVTTYNSMNAMIGLGASELSVVATGLAKMHLVEIDVQGLFLQQQESWVLFFDGGRGLRGWLPSLKRQQTMCTIWGEDFVNKIGFR